MKKILPLLFLFFLSGSYSLLKAQCKDSVVFDDAVNASGSSTFDITTSHCDELIMISYDGWQGPGTGPVTVDGNAATHIGTAFVYYYAVAETYAYIAPSAGTHTIVCTEPPYSSPYFLNSAAAFYAAGTGYQLTIASLSIYRDNTVSCVGGGTVSDTITTAKAGSMIYDNFDCNNGQFGAFTDSWTGATWLNQLHEGDGIDQSEAYTYAPTVGTYSISADCSANPSPCGGLALFLVVIPPPDCGGDTGLTVTPSVNNPICGNCNGSITINVSGGATPYTYFWSPRVSSTNAATGLCAGTYSCTINDASCPERDTTIVVTITSDVISATASVTANENCNGDCIGSAVATITGGTPPFLYNWTPTGGTNATATGLCAGNYTVTVADGNGCTATARVTITQPLPITITQTVNNVLCNGGTGSATVTASGGNSSYSYLWTPSGQTMATATGLNANTYTVLVTDRNGCTGSTTVALTQPPVLTATMGVPVDIPCNGGTGSATVTPGGGTPNYTYAWALIGGTNATGTGLTAGSYTVTVKDVNGCTATADVTITQPLVLSVTTSFTHASCGLPNGTATARVTGGSTPYNYSWSPGGQITATATGLGIGTYTVTITDNNHCTTSASVTVTQPSAVTASITTTNVSCYNGGNGSATVTPGGGTAPYAYLWNPSGQTTATANGLFAVGYTVTVTDANGCTVTASTTLTQPTVVSVTISEPVLICKDSTGIIVASSNGGTAPYTYAWSSGITTTTATATITPIVTNNYSVVVTDAHGCTASANILLQYGPSLSVEILGKNSVCAGDSTTLCANPSGGEGADKYLWEPVNSTNNCITANPSVISIYTLQVVDGCGATTTASTTVYTNPYPVVALSANIYQGCAPLCVQFRNSSSISKGGIGQYVWTFGNRDTMLSANPIYCYSASGNYSVGLTVTSDSGCSSTLNKINLITVFTHPNASFTYAPQPVNILTPTVQFTDESSDKSGIIYRLWNFGDGTDSTSTLQNPIHTYQDTGNYCASLVAMNAHGCTDTTTNCLVIAPAFSLYIPSAFSPNGDRINDVFQPVGKYIKSFDMYIFDRWGLQLYHTTDINKGWDGTIHGGSTQEDTYIYKITVTDAQGTQHSYLGDISLIK